MMLKLGFDKYNSKFVIISEPLTSSFQYPFEDGIARVYRRKSTDN